MLLHCWTVRNVIMSNVYCAISMFLRYILANKHTQKVDYIRTKPMHYVFHQNTIGL